MSLCRFFAIALTAMAFASQAQANDVPVYNIVNLSAAAKTKVARDLMTARLEVSARQPQREKATAEVTKNSNELLRLLRKQPALKIASQNRYSYFNDNHHTSPKKTSVWVDRSVIQIESHDFEALGHFLGQIHPYAAIQDMQFSLSEKQRDNVKKQLTEDALNAFQARAATIAKTLGFKHFRILQITLDSSNQFAPVRYGKEAAPMLMSSAREDNEAIDVEAGEETVRLNVTGSIELY